MSSRRSAAIVRKELREYRRTRSVVAAMAIFPVIFLIQPLVTILLLKSSDAAQLDQRHVLLYPAVLVRRDQRRVWRLSG